MILPALIQWRADSPAPVEAQEFFFEPEAEVQVEAPWWLRIHTGQGHLKLIPRVCGEFSGEVTVQAGDHREKAKVRSSISAGSEHRWSGAAATLTHALAAGMLTFLFTPLINRQYFGPVFAWLWWPLTPLLILSAMGGAIGGKRFLFRVTRGWLAGLAVAGGVVFSAMAISEWTSQLTKDGDRNEAIMDSVFILGGAVGGTLGGWCMSRKLRLPGLLAGVCCAAGLLFAWKSEWGAGFHLWRIFLAQTALVFPLLLVAPWAGALLSPVVPGPGGTFTKQRVVALLLLLCCVPLGIGYGYQSRKPSALWVNRKPLDSPLQVSSNPPPGTILWEVPVDLKSNPGADRHEILPSPTSSDVYVAVVKIQKIDPEHRSILEISPGGWNHVMGKSGVLYFARGEVLFAFRGEKKLFSRHCPSLIKKIVLDDAGNIFVLGDAHIQSRNANGDIRWSYPKPPRGLLFEQGIADRFGNFYATGHHENTLYIFDSEGSLRFKRERHLPETLDDRPKGLSIIHSPSPVLVIGSAYGSMGFGADGERLFASSEPFRPIGSAGDLCYGFDEERSICTIDRNGRRQVLYTSPEPVIGRILLGQEDRIHLLTSGRFSVLNRNGEVERSILVPSSVLSVTAVSGDRIYGFTESSAIGVGL